MSEPGNWELEFAKLAAQHATLKLRLEECEDTLRAIYSGEVDALVVDDDLFTLESAQVAGARLRQHVLDQMDDAVFAFDNDEHLIYMNSAAEHRYGVVASEVLGRHRRVVYSETHETALVGDGDHRIPDPGFARSRTLSVHTLAGGDTLSVESSHSQLSDARGAKIGRLAVIRDVTQRLAAEARRQTIDQLADRLRDCDDADKIAYLAGETIGVMMGASRAGFSIIDPATEVALLGRHWAADGAQALPALVNLRDYGSFVDNLQRGEVVRIADVAADARTADILEKMTAIGVRSIVNVPVLERGRLVAMIYVNQDRVRLWTNDEVAFIREVADRTQASTARARGAAALRQSEASLRLANENLEAAVVARTGELVAAQEELRQSQKMEAVGQLTGGIAHDFNNLLGAMSAALQVLHARISAGKMDGADRYIRIAQDSIKRAAALTQRLLAFARRQTLDPKPTDVNRLISGLEELVRRAVGPDVVLEVVGSGGLWATKVDPSQLENSILNLCINARDAMMPDGGRLTIETANRWLDDKHAAERELPPGQYISVCVTDTGSGMTPEVIQRVFDPFFTTKPLGQGTGLGLSMVYGFVRQSGGQVRVYSEVGSGTTMCLYLPRHLGEAEPDQVDAGIARLTGGDGEAILLIEDEEAIRSLVSEVLSGAGYRVATAEDGPAGLRVLQTQARIDLLITDVGLPGGLNGRQVADAARVARPDLKVLFITGYAENAAVGNGLLGSGMEVMSKPFDIHAFTLKVREMLG